MKPLEKLFCHDLFFGCSKVETLFEADTFRHESASAHPKSSTRLKTVVLPHATKAIPSNLVFPPKFRSC